MKKMRVQRLCLVCLFLLLVSASVLPANAKKKTTYPASFDLRTIGGVTPVRYQKKAGLCWAFAATSAMESNALMHNLGTYDLSEIHLAYFSTMGAKNPLPGLEKDIISFQGDKPWYQYGGYSGFATMFLMNGYGAVDESVAPLSMLPDAPSQSLSSGHAVLSLKGTYEIDGSQRAIMKRTIMTEGAIVCGTHFSKRNSVYFNKKTNALYVNADKTLDHDITIIGWDDNYSRNNFGKYKPKKNGAWLCKNCWGKNFGDNGYFWLSYEDVPSSKDICYAYLVEKANPAVNIYQHDGGYALYGYDDCVSMANVFTASDDTTLFSVSNYLDKTSGTISMDIGGTKDDPTSGNCLLTQTFDAKLAGYRTFPLKEQLLIPKGERFTIVFTFAKPTFGYTDFDDIGDWYIDSDITAQSGQSYIRLEDDEWFTDETWNVRIKAYAVEQ